MAGLPGKRECHPIRGPHAQPRITAIVRTPRRDGGRADSGSGTGPGVTVVKAARSTHRPASNSSAARGWSSVALRQTIRADTVRRKVQPSGTVPGQALFPGRLPQRRVTFPVVGMRVEAWASSPEPAVGGSVTPGTRQGRLNRLRSNLHDGVAAVCNREKIGSCDRSLQAVTGLGLCSPYCGPGDSSTSAARGQQTAHPADRDRAARTEHPPGPHAGVTLPGFGCGRG